MIKNMINQKQNFFGASLGITLLAFCLNAPIAKADNTDKPNIEYQIKKAEDHAKIHCDRIVKKINNISNNNEYKLFCRVINPKSFEYDSDPIDQLKMYVYQITPIYSNKLTINIDFYKDGVKNVAIMENLTNFTMFWLDGRTFYRWTEGITPRPKLLEKYQQEITQILNTYENNPRPEEDMTF